MSESAGHRGGHGANGGTGHFIAQRATAVALVPLVGWFLIALVAAVTGGYDAAVAFIGHPVSVVLLLLLVTAAFYHMQLGIDDVLEDYVSGGTKAALSMLNLVVAAALWLVAVASILMVAF